MEKKGLKNVRITSMGTLKQIFKIIFKLSQDFVAMKGNVSKISCAIYAHDESLTYQLALYSLAPNFLANYKK